jgi:hypothetical protein
MVRALLAGTKTQTRRIVKPQPVTSQSSPIIVGTKAFFQGGGNIDKGQWNCPYGQPGDRLWVKETHSFDPESHPDEAAVIYRADPEWDDEYEGLKWKPSIFMRREYSRLTLEIESIRVERLHDISEADAIAEGIDTVIDQHDTKFCERIPAVYSSDGVCLDPADCECGGFSYVEHYAALWESINGPGSWDANPWLWVVTFRKEEP